LNEEVYQEISHAKRWHMWDYLAANAMYMTFEILSLLKTVTAPPVYKDIAGQFFN